MENSERAAKESQQDKDREQERWLASRENGTWCEEHERVEDSEEHELAHLDEYEAS